MSTEKIIKSKSVFLLITIVLLPIYGAWCYRCKKSLLATTNRWCAGDSLGMFCFKWPVQPSAGQAKMCVLLTAVRTDAW